MKSLARNRILAVGVGVLALTAIATPQLKQILKVGGVLAVVNTFGKDMNRAIDKLWGRESNSRTKTKVVPILSIGSGTAIGAVQIMGPAAQVDRVVAVAQPEIKFLGEVRLRALIPISDRNTRNGQSLSVVENVGVSGIIDIRL